jgi:hypothetical protein
MLMIEARAPTFIIVFHLLGTLPRANGSKFRILFGSKVPDLSLQYILI